jgi:hypothetical protein
VTRIFDILTLPGSGIESSAQSLIYGAGNCTLWLDTSDPTCLVTGTSSDKLISVFEKTTTAQFDYYQSGDTSNHAPGSSNKDTTSFLVNGLNLYDGYLTTQGNPISLVTDPALVPMVMSDSLGHMSLFFVGAISPEVSERFQWIFNANADTTDNFVPGQPCIGGVLLHQNSPTTFQVNVVGNNNNSVTSPTLTPAHTQFVLSVLINRNSSGKPIIDIRLDGVSVWSYDAGSSNPLNLNFANVGIRSIGAPIGPTTGIQAIGEVISYDSRLVNSSALTIENYLLAKWQPAIHAVVIYDLSTSIGTHGQGFFANLPIDYAATVTLTTEAVDAGSGWTATPPVSGNVWQINGVMPSSVSNFVLHVHAVDASGTQSADKDFLITGTLAGTVMAAQTLVYGSNPVVWLDPSDPTCVTVGSGSRVTYLREKVSTAGFNVASTETPTPDTTSFNVTGLAFAKTSEASSGFNYAVALDFATRPDLNVTDLSLINPDSGEPLGNGFIVTDASGYSTIFLVAKYNAKQVSSTPGKLRLRNDFPDNGGGYPDLYVEEWGVKTAVAGATEAIVYQSDASEIWGTTNPSVDYLEANTQIDPNQVVLITWRTGPAGQQIRINGVNSSVTYTEGDSGHWHSVSQKFSQLLGSYAVGSVGELIMYPSYLSDTPTANIEAYLMTKWFPVVATPPTITAPIPDHEYVSNNYSGTVTITNGNPTPVTASIAASAGSAWTITKDGGANNIWHVHGIMPGTPQTVTLTITGTQDGDTTIAPFPVQAVALPTVPVIQTLAPNSGPVSSNYTGLVVILNVHGYGSDPGISVSATAGSGWTIIPDPAHATNTYQVTGVMPGVVTAFNLTIIAKDISTDGLVATTAARTFLMEALSDASVLPTQYPLDPTGELPSNLVSEQQTLTPDNGNERQFLVPILSPYFANEHFVLQYEGEGPELVTAVKGLDWAPVCEFTQLSRACWTPIYGGITILNLKIKGTVTLTYQTLGGNFVLDRRKIFEMLSERTINQKEVDWSHVINIPAFFPVSPHEHDAETDLIGTTPVVSALSAITTAYEENSQSGDLDGMTTHIADHNNPHHMNKGLIGLPLVPNLPVATDAEAVQPNNTQTLLTPHGAAVAAAATLVHATSTVNGIAALNQGNTPGDDNNATDALTAAGLLALMNSPTENLIRTAFNSGETAVQVTPYPMVFPLYWRGIRYANLNAFIYAVETYVGVEYLQFNQQTGEIYFPRGVAPPSLVTTTSTTSSTTRPFVATDPCTMPIRVPT